MKAAVIITNYNMPERADKIAEHVIAFCHRHDVYLVDNGSDLVPPARHTNVWLDTNIQTTCGWLAGIDAAANSGVTYDAYMVVTTSTEFVDQYDFITPMIDLMIADERLVGVHPALTRDSTTIWTHMIDTGSGHPRDVHMIDNIAALWRADWFDSIGRFDPELYMAHGIDLETCWKARRAGKRLVIDERCSVRKITDIGYSMDRMNMSAQNRRDMARTNMNHVLAPRYGQNYWDRLLNEFRSV